MKTREISLMIDGVPFELHCFAQEFIDHVVVGILEALKGTGEIKTVHITIEADRMAIELNNAELPTNAFVKKIVRNTISGMVSSLKGVSAMDRLSLNLKRNTQQSMGQSRSSWHS